LETSERKSHSGTAGAGIATVITVNKNNNLLQEMSSNIVVHKTYLNKFVISHNVRF